MNEVEDAIVDFQNNKLTVIYKQSFQHSSLFSPSTSPSSPSQQSLQQQTQQQYPNNISDKIAIAIENVGYTVKWGLDLSIKYFKINGMFCQHCVNTVQKSIQSVSNVKSVLVDLNRHIATVILNSNCNESEIIDAIVSVGYDAIPYEGSRDVYLQITGMVQRLINSSSLFL